MKTIVKFFSFILITLCLNPHTTNAQCHIDDWNALKDLYESTDGDNWIDNTNWQEVTGNTPTANCNLEDLYGVGLDAQGRVSCLDFDGDGNCEWDEKLGGNNLNGSIPLELGDLTNLNVLWLHSNQLSGSIPPSLGNLINLLYLNLSNNQLSGSIPLELGNLINLKYLALPGNQLTGSIPIELGNLINLQDLWLYENQLSGSIPPKLDDLSNLQYLNLSSNKLTGSIPSELSDLSNLKYLDLSSNELSGSIPPELGNLSDLNILYLDSNQLIGSIPSELGNLSNLQYLFLNSNQLFSSIPSELGNLSDLIVLSLSDNQLSGSIPPELGNLGNLQDLWLHNNELIGNIAPELGNLSNLKNLSLAGNQLIGSIPPELSNLTQLTGLWLSYNQLTGSIPAGLGIISNLRLLEINYNNLSGCYSDNLSMLCTQLNDSRFDGDADISVGNNFEATWKDFCTTGDGTCLDNSMPTSSNVWPGDVNNDGIVNNTDRSILYLFFNESGTPRNQQGIDWQAYPAINWEVSHTNGNDIKHFDCDGNGFINFNDNNAIIDNWGETHNEGFNNPDVPNSIGFGLFGTDYQIYLRPTNQVNTNPLIMDVVLESINGNDLNLFGGYFTIDYNNVNAHITDADVVFYNSWLGIPNNNLMWDYRNFPNSKKIEIAFSKTNGVASLGSGVIGQVAFQIDHSMFNLNPNNPLIVNFAVNQIGAHDTEGNLLPIEDQQYAVNIGNSTCPNNLTIDENTPFQNLYKSGNTFITNSLVIIGQNQQVEYRANRITLTEGFSARAGADFKVRYGGCN